MRRWPKLALLGAAVLSVCVGLATGSAARATRSGLPWCKPGWSHGTRTLGCNGRVTYRFRGHSYHLRNGICMLTDGQYSFEIPRTTLHSAGFNLFLGLRQSHPTDGRYSHAAASQGGIAFTILLTLENGAHLTTGTLYPMTLVMSRHMHHGVFFGHVSSHGRRLAGHFSCRR